MILEVEKLVQIDYKNVKRHLKNEFSHHILCGTPILVYNASQHCKYLKYGTDLYRSLRNKLVEELETYESVVNVELITLGEYFKCECHKKCRTCKSKFCKKSLECNQKCHFLNWVTQCQYKEIICSRRKARKKYSASNNTILLIIHIDLNVVLENVCFDTQK